MNDFDPSDETSWYFGMFTREESTLILQLEKDSGVFLVRDSRSIHGDFVLCVKEDAKISNYIINKIQTNGKILYRIGDQEFSSLVALLSFYKIHYLDTTALIRPAKRPQYVGNCDFAAKYPDNLSFSKGEQLTLLRKDDDDWWTVKDARGVVGSVPGKFLDRLTAVMLHRLLPRHQAALIILQGTGLRMHPTNYDGSSTVTSPITTTSVSLSANNSSSSSMITSSSSLSSSTSSPATGIKLPRSLPAKARAVRTRIPNAYDTTQLKLTVGDEVLVTAMHMTGQWEGVVNGNKGFFPFTHIKFDDELDDDE